MIAILARIESTARAAGGTPKKLLTKYRDVNLIDSGELASAK